MAGDIIFTVGLMNIRNGFTKGMITILWFGKYKPQISDV
jgi:hypothetical protein